MCMQMCTHAHTHTYELVWHFHSLPFSSLEILCLGTDFRIESIREKHGVAGTYCKKNGSLTVGSLGTRGENC